MKRSPRPIHAWRESLPRSLRVFFAVFLAYTALTWISCLVHWRLGYGQAYSSPFIHQSADPFTDFRTYLVRFNRYFHSEQFFEQFPARDLPYFSYPAPAAVVYRALYKLPRRTTGYLALGIVWSLLLTWGLFRVLVRSGLRSAVAGVVAVLTLAAAFPLDFLLERGNIELVVWILVFAGLLLYLKRQENAAALLLGLAASVKIFPILFCGILLHRRRYAALALALCTAVLSDVLALWYAGPTFSAAFHGFNATVGNYQRSYSAVARPADVGMDHSFFALAKVAGQQLGLPFQSWLHPYYLIAGALAMALFFGRSLRLPLANQLLFLAIMVVGLPPNSFDYTLVYLYAPWTVLAVAAVQSWRQRKGSVPGVTTLLLCFVPLLAPFSLFVFNGVRFGGQVQTATLLALLSLCLAYPVPDDLWYRTPAMEPRRG